MPGGAYLGEVLNQVRLKSIKKTSELLDKQVNAQKETSGVHAGSCKPTKKACNENEKKQRKNDAHVKIIFMEGSPL